MKTILGFSSAALAGATAQSIAAAANSGHTAVLNLRFTILYAFVRLFLTGWDLLLGNGERPRASEDDRPASGTSLRLILVVALAPRWIQSIAPTVAVPSPARSLRRPSED